MEGKIDGCKSGELFISNFLRWSTYVMSFSCVVSYNTIVNNAVTHVQNST